MKLFISCISILFLTGFWHQCPAQTNRDSTVARSLRVLQSKLGLSDSQVGEILLLRKKQNRQLDSLQQNNSQSIDERGKELVKVQNQYERQLKGIFNKGQWKEYKEIESANREGVLNKMKDRKIDIKELPRNAD